MKIKRFVGNKVNGFLEFDISFNDDLTFITGINGTGKTSALNSIVALLYPRLDYLGSSLYDKLSLEIACPDGKREIVATKAGNKTVITCSSINGSFEYLHHETSDDVPAARAREQEEEYYKNLLVLNSNNPVLKFIEQLSSPMYLGLERRSLSVDIERMRYLPMVRSRPQHKNIFSRSIAHSLNEALYFAQLAFHQNINKQSQLESNVRTNMISILIDFTPIALTAEDKGPSKAEIKRVREARTKLKHLPEILGVSEKIVVENIEPLLNFLDDKLEIISRKVEKNSKSREDELNSKILAVFEWSYNKAQVDKIFQLSDIISDYRSDSDKIKRRILDFLDAANSFLADSGKKLAFSRHGELMFRIKDETEDRDIRTMSSGEIQLIVILTHLYFNPEVEKANVFIIDEPELSLHVQWQEKFVDGLMRASTGTQFILATHAPSIILDKVDKCIEIKAK